MFDALIIEFDKALRTVLAPAPTSRPRPGADLAEAPMSESDRRHAAALMRINHVGEVCAQALYQGQALTCKDAAKREALVQAAWEETEHLNWTEQRMNELGGRKSLFNPLWYAGSLGMGVVAGLCGDKWNLGFLAETERQVGAHLEDHLQQLPEQDLRSKAVLQQMAVDEAHHADTAIALGAAELPTPIKAAMKLSSKAMTRTAYYL